MKRLLAILLCLSLLLGSMAVLAEGTTVSAPRADVTDVDPPDVVSKTFKENKKTLKPGDTLHVQMKLDDRTGTSWIYVEFYNKSKDTYIYFDMNYDAKSDMYVGTRKLEKFDANGTYVLRYISAADKYGNRTYDLTENGSWSFTLSSAGTQVAKIRENGKTVKPGQGVHIEVKIPEEYKNATRGTAWINLVDVENNAYSTGFELELSSPGVLTGGFCLMKGDHNGKYALVGVDFMDGDYYWYGSVDVTGQYVILKGAADKTTPPKVTSISLKEKGKTLGPGDTVHLSVKATDDTKVQIVEAYFSDKDIVSHQDDKAKTRREKRKTSLEYTEMQYNASSKKWEASFVLPQDAPDGRYMLNLFVIDDGFNTFGKAYEDQYIVYKSPDVVDYGMMGFIDDCFSAFLGRDPSDAEMKQFGKPLASGKHKAVDVILAVMQKSGLLTGEPAAKALWQVMQGKEPGSADLAKTVKNLKTGPEYAIDSLNNAVFRKRCNAWGILPGNLGNKVSDTKVTGVEVDGGRYILKGSTASLAGVTDKNIKKLVVKDTVKANGKTYKVTEIEPIACKGLAKLTTLTLGKNVKAIGMGAFADCAKLKKITILSKKLKTAGTGCFENIKKGATFKCPKGKASKYKKLITKNGKAPKKSKFK